jgi:hypothetical protein
MTPVMEVTGREIDRPIQKANPKTMIAITPIAICICSAVSARDSRFPAFALAFRLSMDFSMV